MVEACKDQIKEAVSLFKMDEEMDTNPGMYGHDKLKLNDGIIIYKYILLIYVSIHTMILFLIFYLFLWVIRGSFEWVGN